MRPHWLSQPHLSVKEHQPSKDFLQAINHCSDKKPWLLLWESASKQSPWWWPFPPGSPHPHPDSDCKTPFFDNSLLPWIHIKGPWGWRVVEVRGQLVGISLIPLGGFQTDQTRGFWQRSFPAESSPSPPVSTLSKTLPGYPLPTVCKPSTVYLLDKAPTGLSGLWDS